MENYVMLFEEYVANKPAFTNSLDADYPARDVLNSSNKYYIVFSKDRPAYNQEGRVHGGASHAIKHLKDLDPTKFYELLNRAKAAISNRTDERGAYIALCLGNDVVRTGDSVGTILNGGSGEAVTLNTLDYVNDKLKMNGYIETSIGIVPSTSIPTMRQDEYRLQPFEKSALLPIIKDMYLAYYSVLNKCRTNAIKISSDPMDWPKPYRANVSEYEITRDAAMSIIDRIVRDGKTISFDGKSSQSDNRTTFYISFEDKSAPIFITSHINDGSFITGFRLSMEDLKRKIASKDIVPIGNNIHMVQIVKHFLNNL